MNRNKYKNYVLQNLSSEHIILKCYYNIVKFFYWIKIKFFYEIIFTLFQFTQRAMKIVPRATLDTRAVGCQRLI
jgi:hypothetical protein